jgi:Ser/Thr protein kinase RdoA (MazF antagonist)
MTETSKHPFDILTPDLLIDAVEAQGFISDGRFIVLNSYENRVYQIGIEDQTPMIAKFYRPGRWTDQQIQEEHDFCFDLQEQELPVVCPWRNAEGKSFLPCIHAKAAMPLS